jgi:hypothetical protein
METSMAISGRDVWRDYVTDGVPSSGNNDPRKAEIRQWADWIEQIITAFTSTGGLIYDTRALLFADLAKPANSMAWVIGDSTAAYNGIYKKVGASGSGSWTRVADLPYSFIVASDAGAGTANAIQATSSLPISGSALVLLNIFRDNGAGPTTVQFNGGPVYTIKTNSGNDPAVGGLTAGMLVLGRVSGSTFRLVSDQVSSSIIAQAEAWAQLASEAADEARSYAEGLNMPPVTSSDVGKQLVVAPGPVLQYQFPPPPPSSSVSSIVALKAVAAPSAGMSRFLSQSGRAGNFIFRAGDYSAQVAADTLNGMYIKADDVAASSGAWVRDFDGENWDPRWFGAVCDQATIDSAVYPVMISLMSNGHKIRMPIGLSAVNASIVITKEISIIGASKGRSGFYATGLAQDVAILDYQGSTGARIQNIKLKNFMLRSDNNLARGFGLTWVNTSQIADIYFYNLYRGLTGNYAWSNNFSGIRCYNITRDAVLFAMECNQATFVGCAFSGENGVRVTGNTAGLCFTNCDFENITSTSGAGIHLAPTTGNFIDSVTVNGGYWEAIKGYAIACFGVDAFSVRGLDVRAAYFYGGYAGKFSSASGNAQYGMVLNNLSGYEIAACVFRDWQTSAFYTNNSSKNGRLTLNPLVSTPGLTTGSFPASVTITAAV